MDVRQVDPRDTTIEVATPTYRVYFWEPVGGESSGFRCYEYEISDAKDVHEVLRWANGEAGTRTFTVHVVIDDTLVRLSGNDPTTA